MRYRMRNGKDKSMSTELPREHYSFSFLGVLFCHLQNINKLQLKRLQLGGVRNVNRIPVTQRSYRTISELLGRLYFVGGGGEAVECNGSQREWLVGSVLLKFCHAFHCVNSKVLKVSLRQLDALLSDTCKVKCFCVIVLISLCSC